MNTEYDKLIRHIGHKVDIVLPGYDAPVSLNCRDCSAIVLIYSDPAQFTEKDKKYDTEIW